MYQIRFDNGNSIESFAEKLHQLEKPYTSILIFCSDESRFCNQQLDWLFISSPAVIIGGLFPSIIYNQKLFEKEALLIGQNKSERMLLPFMISASSVSKSSQHLERAECHWLVL